MSAPRLTYGALGSPWPDIPARIQGWRIRNDRIEVRWAYRNPKNVALDDEGLAELSGFEVQTRLDDNNALTSSGTSNASTDESNAGLASFRVDISDIDIRTSSTDGLALMRVSLTAIDLRPMSLRIRPVTSAGPGNFSDWTPGVPSTCIDGEFLTTHLAP